LFEIGTLADKARHTATDTDRHRHGATEQHTETGKRYKRQPTRPKQTERPAIGKPHGETGKKTADGPNPATRPKRPEIAKYNDLITTRRKTEKNTKKGKKQLFLEYRQTATKKGKK
jgi:hypothetical protein